MTFTNFIKRPVLSTVVSIFFVLLGMIGLISLPIEQYPDIAPPTISVMANYQGADAQTVLNSVVTPLEESINGVENMTYIQSTATNAGLAMITVYFKQGSDPNMASVNVQNRVSQAQALLPAEVTRAGVTVSKRCDVYINNRRRSLRRRIPHKLQRYQHYTVAETHQWRRRCAESGYENLLYAYMVEARKDEAIWSCAKRYFRCIG